MTRRLKHVEGPFVAIELERVGLLEDRRTDDRWMEVIHDHPEDRPMLDEHVEIVGRWWGVYGRRADGRAVWLQDHVWFTRAVATAEALARGYGAPLVRGRGVPGSSGAAC